MFGLSRITSAVRAFCDNLLALATTLGKIDTHLCHQFALDKKAPAQRRRKGGNLLDAHSEATAPSARGRKNGAAAG